MTYSLYATCAAPGRRLKTFDLKNRLWGDEYQTSLATKMAAKYMGIPLGGSPTGALSISALQTYGKMQISRLIGDAVTILRLTGNVQMRIASSEDNLIMPDAHHGKTFYFSNASTSGIVDVLSFLDEAGLNKMGPLSDISMCLSKWMGQGAEGRHICMFQFSH